MSRRDLLGALVALALPARSVHLPTPLVGQATQLNHATLKVRNVARSQEFYQKLFGMPVLTHQGLGVNLRAGAGFIGLYPLSDGSPPGIDHVCLSVDDFEATRVLPTL